MSCSFKILWFEDEVVWYDINRIKLEELLKPHCLKADIERKRGGDFTEDLLSKCDYDLILMDYKLTTDETGEKIISRIRENNVLTDILFYSSQYETMLESIKALSPPIDGIYYTNRKEDEFDYKLKTLIDKIVRRSEDLVHLRGFVLDNSCDFETRIVTILEICWQKFNNNQKTMLDEKVRKIIEKLIEKKEEDSKNLLKKDSSKLFPAAIKPSSVLSHTERLQLLDIVICVLHKEYAFPLSSKHVEFRNNYELEFSNYRNSLGHRKDSDTTIQVRGKTITIDQSLHRQLRATIHEYNDLINAIQTHVSKKM